MTFVLMVNGNPLLIYNLTGTLYADDLQVVVTMTNSITYTNTGSTGNFTRNNCGSGTGSIVLYIVPGGVYTSTISQADAEQKAQADVNANGQAYANVNGTCTWSNVAKSGTFTKTDCAEGGTGSSVTYTVAAGTYTSTVSLADADQKAQTAVNNNGQSYANANGYCTWYNDAVSGYHYSQSCGYGYTPQPYQVSIAANQFSSTISKADANYQAQVAAQNQANANGTCVYNQTCQPTCSGEGQKCINGNCEPGYRVYTYSSYNPYTGMYECVYHYEWLDGTWSPDYIEYSNQGSCLMQAS